MAASRRHQQQQQEQQHQQQFFPTEATVVRDSVFISDDTPTDAVERPSELNLGVPDAADLSGLIVHVFVRVCYEQWGRWRNYHLFRIFATFKDDPRVKMTVELILPKMAMEISINGQMIYSRLMKSGYHSHSNLTDFVVGQVNMALTRNPLNCIPAADYASFLAQFRRRASNCMDQTDLSPCEEMPLSTLNSLRDKGTMSLQTKGRRRQKNSNTSNAK